MNRLTKSSLLGAVLALGISAFALSQEDTAETVTAAIAIDQPAPEFTLKDIEGKDVKLSQFNAHGRPFHSVVRSGWRTGSLPLKLSAPRRSGSG